MYDLCPFVFFCLATVQFGQGKWLGGGGASLAHNGIYYLGRYSREQALDGVADIVGSRWFCLSGYMDRFGKIWFLC